MTTLVNGSSIKGLLSYRIHQTIGCVVFCNSIAGFYFANFEEKYCNRLIDQEK